MPLHANQRCVPQGSAAGPHLSLGGMLRTLFRHHPDAVLLQVALHLAGRQIKGAGGGAA